MVSRKSHPKSRNGCAQCKKRRIKCDEVAPRCSNCLKHSIECDFSLDPDKAAQASPKSPRKRGSESTKSSATKSTGTITADQSPATPHAPFDAPAMNLPYLHMDELELLHHFTTDTCFTLSDRAESHALWQITVPQEAFKQAFLMRGILAISALHLSYLRPDRHDYYTNLAVRNQNSAIGTFRSLMTAMDESNADAFFALSSLIVVYGFESPKASEILGLFNYKGEHADEWLPLIRGVNSIIQNVYPLLKTGRLSRLLHDHQNGPPTTGLPTVLEAQLDHLESLCGQASGGEDVVQMYKMALGSLRDCFIRMNNRTSYECEVSISFIWPVMIPQDFVDRLHREEPIALIILAHYCLILHHLDSYWWMNGWARHIVQRIDGVLDEDMRYWLRWPTSVVTVSETILTNGAPENPIPRTRVSDDFHTSIDRSLTIPSEQSKHVEPATAKSDQL